MRKKGFTLLELLVVVAIIGIICAIAIPNLLYAVQRAKQRRTMLDMKNMALAWEARNTEVGRYNAAGQGSPSYEGCDQKVDVADVVGVLTPTYIKTVPHTDAWGNLFACYVDQQWGGAAQAQKYVIISGGHDGKIDSEAGQGAITNFDCDIVYGSGRFLSYPDGLTLK